MKITEKQEEYIKKLVSEMTVDEMCGQLINYNVSGKFDTDNFEKFAKKVKPGAIFVAGNTKEEIKAFTEIANKYCNIPLIVSADLENGPGSGISGEGKIPDPMTWGAADDEELIEQAGRITGEAARRNGVHWSFAPIVDINYNKDNPVTNIRAISDSPKQVAKIAGAYVRGMQANNMMIAGCKHFPGDGMDDRNQHFCTTINPLSKDEWLKTYGYVYKKMFEAGTESVMVGHIALPAIEDNIDPVLGPKPGTLSYNIMTNLLRKELGFEGCIVSDAMAMVGACSMCAIDDLSVEFVKAGGDMVLFARELDYDCLKKAVLNGELPKERLCDAVTRILRMKAKIGLFDNTAVNIANSGDISDVSQKIAEKSIKIVRNSENNLPLKLKPGSKILIITMQTPEELKLPSDTMKELDTTAEELEKRGFVVKQVSARTIDHHELETTRGDYDCILINCKISCRDYLGGTLRINRDNIMPFWRGAVLNHPNVIFASFGDPYKLYDLPFLKTYVNAFSASKDSQKAFVKVILGEIEETAKNPVGLKDFFECEV